MSDSLDLTQQHTRFRTLVQELVQGRRQLSPEQSKTDWIVVCFDSREAFAQHFPDRAACDRWLTDQERYARETAETVGSEIDRILREGFSYQDLESLRYEFPRLEEDNKPN